MLFLPNAPVAFGRGADACHAGGYPYAQLAENADITSFQFIHDCHLLAPNLVLNRDFGGGLLPWDQYPMGGAAWVWAAGKAQTTLDATSPESDFLGQLIPFGAVTLALLEWEAQGLTGGAQLEVHAVDNTGASLGLLGTFASNGALSLAFAPDGADGIAFQAKHPGPGSLSYDITLDNVTLRSLDNCQEVCLKDEAGGNVASLGRDWPVYYADGQPYVAVSFRWEDWNLPEGCYRIYVHPVCEGAMGALDTGFILDDASTPWDRIMLGGAAMCGYPGPEGPCLRLESDSTNLPLGVSQSAVLTPGERYRLRFRIRPESTTSATLSLRAQLSSNTTALRRTAPDVYEETLRCTDHGDFALYCEAAPADNGRFLFIDSLEIIPILEEAHLSEPFHLAEKHPCTLRLTWAEAQDRFGFVYRDGFRHGFRVSAGLRHLSYKDEKEFYEDADGVRHLIFSNPRRRAELVVAEQPPYVHAALGLAFSHSDLEITDGAGTTRKYLGVDNDYAPVYRATSVLAPVGVEIEEN